jgi:flagellar basal body-associated protein FliL
MNLLMLILIFLALLVCAGVFYVAWRLSSGEASPPRENEEPGNAKE